MFGRMNVLTKKNQINIGFVSKIVSIAMFMT